MDCWRVKKITFQNMVGLVESDEILEKRLKSPEEEESCPWGAFELKKQYKLFPGPLAS